jgi:hypothetical protein
MLARAASHFLTVSFLFLSVILHAQQFDVKVSPSFKRLENGNIVRTSKGFLAMEQTDIKAKLAYTIKLDKLKFGIKLSSYDQNMKLKKELQLQSGESTFGPFTPQIEEINEKFYLFYFKMKEQGAVSVSCMAAEIDADNLAIGKEVELFSTDLKNFGMFKVFSLLSKSSFRVATSPDDSKAMVMWATGMSNEYYLTVFDKSMNVLWKKKENASISDEIVLNSVCIDNAGTVYITYDTDKEDDVQKLIVSEQKKRTERDLNIEGGNPFQVIAVASTSGNFIHLVGTYKNASDNLAGVFHQKLPLGQARASAAVKTEFSPELVERLDKLGWANDKSKKYGLYLLGMTAVATEGDNIAMTGCFRKTVVTDRSSQHYSGSILGILFNDGKATIGLLPKQRISASTTMGDSYFAIASGEHIVIFYNDYDKNVEKGITDKFTNATDPSILVLVAATMDHHGNFQRKVVIDLTKEDFLLLPEKASWFQGGVTIPGVEIKGMMGLPRDEGVMTVISFK